MLKKFKNSSCLKRFLNNQDGTAAIEFVFIAPVMIITYFGLAAISLLVGVDRNVSHATSVAADLATQSESLSRADIEDIFEATVLVLGVNFSETSNLTIDIRSFEMDGGGVVQEVGFAKLGTGLATKYTPSPSIAATLLNQTSGLVVTRIEYDYQSLGYYTGSTASELKESFWTPTLSETFMLKPRKSATIPFVNGGSSTVTCTYVDASPPEATCS